MSTHVRGFAEGIAGQAIAIVAGLAVALAVGTVLPDFEPATLVLAVVIAPWLLGASVPVHRHGLVAAAGVATGWLLVFAALLLVAVTTNDPFLAEEGLGYLFIGWLLVLLLEAIAVGAALSLRRIDSPPPPIRIADIRELDAKFKPPDFGE